MPRSMGSNPDEETAFSFVASLERFLLRELSSLRLEVEAYSDDALLWVTPPGLPNSGGTLTLHLSGNLRHYIGARLGGDGYVRDRDAEFSTRDLTRRELLEGIADAQHAIRSTFAMLTEEQLSAPYPETLRGTTLETGELLLQLAVHLGYHLGQISYHRRLVTGNSAGVGTLDPAKLATVGPTTAP